jgi:hypothetical protein
MNDELLNTDNGIIAAALMLYHNAVEQNGGPAKLADRAYALYLKYRDMEEIAQ